jgi:hypothetical protein
LAFVVVAVAGIVLASMGKLPWQQGTLDGSLASGDSDGGKTLEVSPTADKAGKQSPDERPASLAIDRHTDFLDGVDARRQALSGQWDWDGQALTSPATTDRFADFALPGKPPEEYMLTVTAARQSGSDGLRLGLVSGDRSFVVVFDLNGVVTSFGQLDGAGPGEHAATVRGSVFWKDKPITVSCKVRTRDRRTQLDVDVEGERMVAWAGETASLVRPPNVTKDAALFIGTLSSSFRITRLELTPLVNGQPAPRWKTPPLTPNIEMVKVPAGKFWMGAADDESRGTRWRSSTRSCWANTR